MLLFVLHTQHIESSLLVPLSFVWPLSFWRIVLSPIGFYGGVSLRGLRILILSAFCFRNSILQFICFMPFVKMQKKISILRPFIPCH